jgi:single-stranded DNA-specific DHH superfamily exonuclease
MSKNLAGVGVMFYVLLALRAELRVAPALSTSARNRDSTCCWTWSLSARWLMWCGWTATTGCWWQQASSACARGACKQGVAALFRIAGREPQQCQRTRSGICHRTAHQRRRTPGRHVAWHCLPV